jgi:hypothetical protein
MNTYIIDNGLKYSSHELHFVEAPKSFGKWFEETLVPWLSQRNMWGSRLRIVATCSKPLDWREPGSSLKLEDFLNTDHIIEGVDYDEIPPQHRPRYRGI